jgi:mono/diheme cytochrome c family protein
MRNSLSLIAGRKLLRIIGIALTGCAAAGSGAYAAPEPVPQSRYATLNCEQLRVEYLKSERGLVLDKSGVKMPGVDEGAGMKRADTTYVRQDRSTAMSDALGALDLLSRVYIAKRCDSKGAQKSRLLTQAGAISTFAPMADLAMGQRDYRSQCAMCHGADGKSGGWLVQYLSVKPPALAQLKKNAGGVFPIAHVYDVIDGRLDVAAHGPREMPVWGDHYRSEARGAIESYVGEASHPESNVRAKIYALLKCIFQLQE